MGVQVVDRVGIGGALAALALCTGLFAVFAAWNPAGAQASPFWSQLGTDIDGENPFDASGRAVAMSADGSTVIIGAPNNGGASLDSGHARVFSFDGADWNQMGDDIDGEATLDGSGAAVAMSADGKTVVIGAPRAGGATSFAGHARIFNFDGSTWNQVGAAIDAESADNSAGSAVAMSADGNTVIIGAVDNPGPNGGLSFTGHARIFNFDGAKWNQVGVDIDGENAGDQSGRAVAMSADGNTVIIGAAGNDGNGPGSGHARIFSFDGSAWVQVGADIDGEEANDASGSSVAMSADGRTVIIGAPKNTGNATANDLGHARIYNWNGTSWNQVGADLDGEAAEDFSVSAVAMSADGNTVIVGALTNDGNGDASGHSRIYHYDGTEWNQVGVDIDGENAGDQSGRAVAMSADGNTVAIGAAGNDGNGPGSGHARIYRGPVAFCNDLPVTVDLGAGEVPTTGDDVILGTSSADVITALGGHDTICGEGGGDVINGGLGNDWVDAGDGDDLVFGLDGSDVLFGGGGADQIVAGNGSDFVDGGNGADSLNGGPGNDSIFGRAGNDQLFGQGGNDALNGGDDNDLIVGVDGVDTLNGGEGDDVVNGGSGNDTVNGDAGNDILFGLTGADTVNGGDGNDSVFGQVGADVLDGGAGNDELQGNQGNDVMTDPSGFNTFNGGPGNDTMTGGTGVDAMFGDGDLSQAGDDTLDGGLGADRMLGFAGEDTITSDDGIADTVNGGPGVDSCTTDGIDTVFNCP